MKKQLPFITCIFLFLSVVLSHKLQAQPTTISAIYTPAASSAGSAGAGSGITFSVQNTNGSAVILRGVDYHSYTGTHTWELWYSATSLTGNPGPITTAAGWTRIAGPTPVTNSVTGVIPIFSNMNFSIPANTTYRFVIGNTHTQISYGAASSTPNIFSAIGVNLLVGNNNATGYAGNYVTPNWAFQPRFFNGKIHVEPGQPCVNPPTAGTPTVSDTAVCANTSIDLSLVGNSSGMNLTFQWEYSPDNITYNSISGIQSVKDYTHNATNTGFYRCKLVCSNGTPVFSLPVFVRVKSPTITDITDTNVCQNHSATLFVTTEPGSIIKWYNSPTATTPIFVGNPYITPTIIGNTTYYATSSTPSDECPTAKVPAVVTAIPNPTVDLGGTIDKCVDIGHIEPLNARNPGNFYNWDNGYNGQVRVVTQSGKYWVELTNSYNCKSSDTVNVILKNNPVVNLGNDTNVCRGVSVQLDAGPDGISYFWNSGHTTRNISTQIPGRYTVQVLGENGCIKIDSIEITQIGRSPSHDGMWVNNLGGSTFKFELINPSNITSYAWDFGDGTPIAYSNSPTHTYPTVGNYLVSLVTTNNCGNALDTSTIHVLNSTSIDEVTNQKSPLKVYPIPTNQKLNISTINNVRITSVTITDLQGKTLNTHHYNNALQCSLDLGQLANANYFVIVKLADGTQWIEKIIIAK